MMLTRRELLKQVGALLAGGVAAGSGIVAIVPVEPEVAHPLSAKAFIDTAMQPFADGMQEGIGGAIKVIPITPSLDEAYHNYALALGKGDWELTDNEKRRAFLNAALDHAPQRSVHHSPSHGYLAVAWQEED